MLATGDSAIRCAMARVGGDEELCDTLPGFEQVVVVIEPDTDQRDLVQEVLETAGHPVYAARNGREALAALARMPPPLVVVVDLWMPGMNGFEVIQAIRANEQLAATPIVLMTTEPVRNDEAAVLLKPFAPERLLALVRQASLSCA